MKRSITITLSILIVLTLAGCKTTPKNNIVKGKNLDKMINSATKTQEGGTNSAQGVSISEKIGAKKTYVKELVDVKGKVKIHVNADVVVPDSKGITIQKVQKESFSQKTVDILRQQLVKGQLFSGDDYKLTRSQIQQQILDLEAAIAKGPSNNTKINKGGFDARKTMVADLKEKLKTAPDTTTKKNSTGKLEADKESGGEKLYGLAQSEKAGYESLGVYNYDNEAINYVEYTSEKSGFSKRMGTFMSKEQPETDIANGFTPYITPTEMANIPDIAITENAAKQKAEALISSLGINGLKCYTAQKLYGGSTEKTSDLATFINPRQCVWYLRYTRNVNGIPLTYTPYDCIKTADTTTIPPWNYEDMTFAIDDSGIVGFYWNSPYKVTGTVTENSNLLSFDQSMNVFNNMALVVNSWDGIAADNPRVTGVEINVNHIKLGLSRITEQDKRDSGLLVPVWDFFGSMTYINKVNGETKNQLLDENIPILTVNAIDGSIINRSLGY